MTLPDKTRIAGDMTVADWKITRDKLENAADANIWKTAFCEFFKKRLETRYFRPIRALEDMKDNDGEGFAIVALHCSLIEFLASTLEGKTYRYMQNGQPPLGQFEYAKSGDMFIAFLVNREPFKVMFSDPGTAKDFYASVRCGLLHEARTKNGWLIRIDRSAASAVDTRTKIVYRNKMQDAFDQFVTWYEEALSRDGALQKAFIRKFDSLCDN